MTPRNQDKVTAMESSDSKPPLSQSNPANTGLDAATEEELDNWILDLVLQGSLLPRGKTINADMFPEAKAALARLLIRERHRALLGVNNQDIVFIDLGDGEKQYIPVSKLREREAALEAQLEKEAQ